MVDSENGAFEFDDSEEEESDDDFVVNKKKTKKKSKKKKKQSVKKLATETAEVSETVEANDEDIEEGSDDFVVTKTYVIPAPAPPQQVVPSYYPGAARRIIVMGNRRIQVDYRVAPFILLILAHLMVLIVGSVPKYDLPHHGYAVFFSIVGILLSVVGIVLVLWNNTFGKELGPSLPRSCSSITVGKVLATILFLFDYIGAMYLTFNSPFEDINGFFALWVSVYGSVLAIDLEATPMNEPLTGVDSLKGLLVAVFTHAVAVVWLLATEFWVYTWYSLGPSTELYVSLMIALSTLSSVGIVECSGRCKRCARWMYLETVACWIVVICLVTIRGPFDGEVNVWYLSAWFSGYFSVMRLAEEFVTKESPGFVVTPPPVQPPVAPTEEHEMDA